MPDTRPGPLQLLAKTANRARRRGPKEVCALAWARAREAVSSQDELIVLRAQTGGVPQAREGLSLREATSRDAEQYAREIATDSPSTFRARLSAATRCFVVVADGRFIHATWTTTAAAWTRELGCYVVPPPGDAYTYESFTRPDARGRGAYPLALTHILAVLAQDGVRTLWVAVEATNAGSLRAVTKAGFTQVGRISYSRRFGIVRLDRATGLPERFLSRSVGRRH